MPIDFFGYTIGKKNIENPKADIVAASGKSVTSKSFVEPARDDGAVVVEAGGFYGSYVDMEGAFKNDIDLINKYRDMSMHAEIEMAVDDITNEAIVVGEKDKTVELNLENLEVNDSIKKKLQDEFDNILRLLNFDTKGYEIFRRWYIESRLYYHMIPHEQSTKGLKEIRPIDPTEIRKIRNVHKKKDEKTGIEYIEKVEEFFMYTQSQKKLSDTSPNTAVSPSTNGIKVAPDAICFVPSGLYDATRNRIFGYLQKAIKPLNQLRMIEDAVVIYRISRAPERRVFYIDVGSLPKTKAEQYIRDMMNRYRNKLVYDASSGEIRDDRRHMSMLEDFWLPRKEGGRGTEIQTLGGGENLGEMEDVEYFKKKLYQSLNIPASRMEADNGFNMGRSSEITRDEVKFFKFIQRLRNKFSELFLTLLRTQCLLKNIMTEDEWNEYLYDIRITFNKDSYFTELKENEILKERMEILRDMTEYIGRFYSNDWVRKNILKQSEEDIEEIDKQILEEKKSKIYSDAEDDQDQQRPRF